MSMQTDDGGDEAAAAAAKKQKEAAEQATAAWEAKRKAQEPPELSVVSADLSAVKEEEEAVSLAQFPDASVHSPTEEPSPKILANPVVRRVAGQLLQEEALSPPARKGGTPAKREFQALPSRPPKTILGDLAEENESSRNPEHLVVSSATGGSDSSASLPSDAEPDSIDLSHRVSVNSAADAAVASLSLAVGELTSRLEEMEERLASYDIQLKEAKLEAKEANERARHAEEAFSTITKTSFEATSTAIEAMEIANGARHAVDTALVIAETCTEEVAKVKEERKEKKEEEEEVVIVEEVIEEEAVDAGPAQHDQPELFKSSLKSSTFWDELFSSKPTQTAQSEVLRPPTASDILDWANARRQRRHAPTASTAPTSTAALFPRLPKRNDEERGQRAHALSLGEWQPRPPHLKSMFSSQTHQVGLDNSMKPVLVFQDGPPGQGEPLGEVLVPKSATVGDVRRLLSNQLGSPIRMSKRVIPLTPIQDGKRAWDVFRTKEDYVIVNRH